MTNRKKYLYRVTSVIPYPEREYTDLKHYQSKAAAEKYAGYMREGREEEHIDDFTIPGRPPGLSVLVERSLPIEWQAP